MGKNLLSVVFSLAFVIAVSFSVSAQIQVGPSPDDSPNLPEPDVKASLVTPDRPSLPPLVPGIPGSGELETSGLPKSSSPPAQAQLRRPPDVSVGPSEPIREESLDAPNRPPLAPLAPRRARSIEFEATKGPKPQSWDLLGNKEVLGGIIILLIFSLLGNAFQLYRQRFYGKTLCNELMSTFNSVAWMLARCVNKTKELDERSTADKTGDLALQKEFREFSLDTEFMLRALHEQLVAVARNLGRRNKSWKAGQFGYTLEEVQRIRRTFSERPIGDGPQALKSASG